jgi:hypothetical protein
MITATLTKAHTADHQTDDFARIVVAAKVTKASHARYKADRMTATRNRLEGAMLVPAVKTRSGSTAQYAISFKNSGASPPSGPTRLSKINALASIAPKQHTAIETGKIRAHLSQLGILKFMSHSSPKYPKTILKKPDCSGRGEDAGQFLKARSALNCPPFPNN